MAQTGYTPIVLYASGTATNTPTSGNLASGELAINYADGKLFYKDSSGVVQVLATKATTAGTFTTVTTSTLTSPSATALTIQSASTTAITVDTSQNVGIGTSSPDAKFSIKNPNVSGSQTVMTILGATSAVDLFAMTANQTTDVVALGTNYAGSLAFNTNSTERMRIDSSGNLCLGQASSTVGGSSWKQAIQFTSLGIGFSCTNSSGNMANFYTSTSTFAGSITASGSTTTYATSSDYRLKENIAPMIDALAKVQALKPVTYNWKSDGTSGQGFIAHELQAIVPDCVVGKKDAVETVDDVDTDGKVIGTKEVPKYQGIDTSFLVAILTAAIQEQQALIESLTTRLTALENK